MDKKFLYSLFDQKLVDDAIKSTKQYFYKEKFKDLYNCSQNNATYEKLLAEIAKLDKNGNLPKPTGKDVVDILYDKILHQMVFSFLQGALHAVLNNLTNISPSKDNFSEYRKNYNFAILFNFGDNDFTHSIECGAKLFCDEFNRIFDRIDIYGNNNCKISYDYYIDKLNTLTKIENIKEIMKMGFFSEEIRMDGECTHDILSFESTLKDAKKSLEYLEWDEDINKWERLGDDYVITETLPRFIIGTNEEIADAIKKYGSPRKNPDPDDEFPVWCNSEVIVLYMKDGYLTYTTR